ncbi:MAG: lipid-A-disaccharide synthase [Planctomyces sp.]|nr:lipid-A-disaccharide synthase [Planctomyces sp.]
MHVFFSVGEPSGDHHAAHLIQELRRRQPNLRASGFGGPLMEQAGLESLFRLTDLAVMGIGAVIPQLRKFFRLRDQAAEFLQRERPDLCVLIDYPGFNWHIAAAAKQAGVEVVYYCPPQLWAWGTWRLRKLRRTVDRVLSVLPFEAEWYRERNIPVDFVGHPFFDELSEKTLDADACRALRDASPRRVALLPGSRTHEVHRNFPVMLDVVRRLARRHPDLRFPVACFRESQRRFCQNLLDRQPGPLPVDLHCGRTPEIIDTADCVLMVSGSVSLEVLARAKPAAVMYRGGLLMGSLAWFLVHCKYMSLPNLMLDREMMPEFPFMIRAGRHAKRIARTLDGWLSNPEELQAVARDMVELRDRVAQPGGIARAAEALLRGRAFAIPDVADEVARAA